jgi:DNA uptake protein ComE-like DNA-binding protein
MKSILQLAAAICLAAVSLAPQIWASPRTIPESALSPAIDPDARVDINSAHLEELLKVPGMTKVWARRIVRFRPYRAKNDLVDRGVVTGEVYSRIKDYIIAHHIKQ